MISVSLARFYKECFIVRFREAKKAEFEKSKLEREEAMSERKRTKDAEIEAERTQKELEKMYEKLQYFCQKAILVNFVCVFVDF